MKKGTVLLGLTALGLALFLAAGCAGAPEAPQAQPQAKPMEAQAPAVEPQPGTFSGSGWGTVKLQKDGDGYVGTYTDTWASDHGDIVLYFEDGAWMGTWEEPAIDRGGTLYEISISEDGKTITGLADVTRAGGHSPFTDEPFTWKFE